MAKNLEFALLIDIYGGLLTLKQREVMELYYFDDLSLSEIAEDAEITRQGVHEIIKRSENLLMEYDNCLKFKDKFINCDEILEKIEMLSGDNIQVKKYAKQCRELLKKDNFVNDIK